MKSFLFAVFLSLPAIAHAVPLEKQSNLNCIAQTQANPLDGYRLLVANRVEPPVGPIGIQVLIKNYPSAPYRTVDLQFVRADLKSVTYSGTDPESNDSLLVNLNKYSYEASLRVASDIVYGCRE